jgi:uncharacterized membrane protein YciS (DUF1049 family)
MPNDCHLIRLCDKAIVTFESDRVNAAFLVSMIANIVYDEFKVPNVRLSEQVKRKIEQVNQVAKSKCHPTVDWFLDMRG